MSDSYRPASLDRSLSELSQLLDLAESVASQLRDKRLANLRQVGAAVAVVFMVATGALLAFLQLSKGSDSSEILRYVAGFYGAAGALSYIVAAVAFIAYRKHFRAESNIVTEVIDMASSILSMIEPQISRVEYALMRMRLRRLQLNSEPMLPGSMILKFGP